MRIRHLVAADNVDALGFVVQPQLVRHGLIVGGRVAQVAAPIDPATHLNFDFPDHRLEECLVVAELAAGASALRAGAGFQLARVRHSAYGYLGAVSVDARRLAWQQALEKGRTRDGAR